MKESTEAVVRLGQGQLYGGFTGGASDDQSVLANVEKGMKACGIACTEKGKGPYKFGVMTVNNLPFLFEVKANGFGFGNSGEVTITYRIPVPKIAEIFIESLQYLFTRQQAGQ
jgi:hypothetical protein